MGERADALRKRVADFALGVLRFVRGLPKDLAADSVIRQVARSAGGVSANYRSACCARSRPEFIAKLGVALEEADETDHWLWMAVQLNLGNSHELARLTAEAKELRAILSASLSTARRNFKREQEQQRSARSVKSLNR